MKNLAAVFLLTLATIGFSGVASAQRGGAHCNVETFRAQNLANRIQQNSFVIRDTVSNLPRPQVWMPYARPVGQATRTILNLVNNGQRRGVCRQLGMEIRSAERAIATFKRQLDRQGRGYRAEDLKRKLRVSERMLSRLHYVLVRGRSILTQDRSK
jgi:hypothetical protein